MPKVAKDSSSARPVKQFLIVLVAILAVFVVVMNLLQDRLNPLRSQSSAFSKDKDVEITIFTDKTVYQRNESMLLSLAVKNRTDKAIHLEFPTSQQYNFLIKREYDFVAFKYYLEVWQANYGRPVKAEKSTLVIPPKETVSFKETWRLEDAKRNAVAPGRYVIWGILPASGGYKTELQLRAKTTK